MEELFEMQAKCECLEREMARLFKQNSAQSSLIRCLDEEIKMLRAENLALKEDARYRECELILLKRSQGTQPNKKRVSQNVKMEKKRDKKTKTSIFISVK